MDTIIITADRATNDNWHSGSLILSPDFKISIPAHSGDGEPVHIYGTGPEVHWMSDTQWFINTAMNWPKEGRREDVDQADPWAPESQLDYLCYFVTLDSVAVGEYRLQQVKWGDSTNFFNALKRGEVNEELLQYPDETKFNKRFGRETRTR